MLRLVGLEWDDDNEEHIARHGIVRKEVEDVCFGRHWAIRARGKNRMSVFGQTAGGRYVLAIVERVAHGIYRPITARQMNSKERRRFQIWRGS